MASRIAPPNISLTKSILKTPFSSAWKKPLQTSFNPARSIWSTSAAASAIGMAREGAFGKQGAQQHGAQQQQTSSFSTTTSLGKKRGGSGRPAVDRRVKMIRYAISQPLLHTPRPLRLSRLRALRHWTIHRAWQLWQRQQRQAQDLALERQWESMRAACEELRVGAGDGGRLFRQAMARKGYFGGRSEKKGEVGIREGFETGDSGRVEKGREGGVPIEYSRSLVDFPAKDGAWDHAWVRG